MKRAKFSGHVKGGKTYIDNRGMFDLFMRTLEGKNFNLEVWQAGRKRSSPENRYFHSVICQYMGDIFYNLTAEPEYLTDKERVKDLLKVKFLSRNIVNPDTGEIVATKVLKTSELSMNEMENFMQSIRDWAARDFGVIIPLPNENVESI